MGEPVRILFVDDNPDDIELQRLSLKREGLEFQGNVVASEADLKAALEEFRPDLVLCDYSIPGFSGMRALKIVKEAALSVPFIFVSGTIPEERAIECLREGATDYVLKGNPQRLGSAVRRALSEAEDRKAYESRIRYLANFDGLTELPNRTLLDDRIAQALVHTRRMGGQVAVVTFNLDGFRLINQGFGHSAADTVLKEMARRLRSHVREGDTVARTGADEFTVLLSDLTQPDDLHEYLANLRDVLDATYSVGEQALSISASAGVAVFPADGETPEALLRNAGAAMHRAKSTERGGLRFSSPETLQAAMERLLIEAGLTRALSANEFSLCYQLQVSLADGSVCGAEALVRWPRDERISPATFIRVAEETGLIRRLGQWALEEACAAAKAWIVQAPQRHFIVGVNVSPVQLRDPGFVDSVSRIIRASGLAPERIELEMTEGALMAGGGVEALSRLRALGVKIAVDDFGTGYSSLSYLSRLPLDRIKIDRSFVNRMTTDPRDAAIVKAIVSLGHGMGVRVIAEGVETREQLDSLRAIGCDEVQGYLFSRAVAASEMPALLERRPAHFEGNL